MSLDAEGTVRLWNRAAERIFGFSADEAIGRFLPTVPQPLRRRFQAQLERVLLGHISRGIETRRQRKDGSFIDVALWPARVRGLDGRFECLAVAADISDRKRLERQLRQHVSTIAEQARQKDDFLAVLSHELRNPLTPILASLELVQAQGGDIDQMKRCLDVIGRQASSMARLIDDLLDVSRIRRGKTELRKEPMDVCASLFRTAEALQEVTDARGLQVQVVAEPGLWIDGDPVRIGQILNNLLQNAIKYTEEGGRIWLSAAREDDSVVIRVRDTGIGMPQGLTHKIFDLFAQSEQAKSQASGGLGIGLTVVRGLVEMHQGTVLARSGGPGQGSEFEIRLPETKPPEPKFTGRKQVPVAEATPAMRVLLVDDNVDAATTLSQLIGLWGHQVWTAHDGPSAIEIARRERPDVVILDIGLPGMDGYETAQNLRAHAETRDCQLVALTGYSQRADRERAKEVGFARHLVKPVDAAALKELLAAPPG
jgi:PAS domain S-box-containing protein